ncbi:hypothetical protein GCM10009530_22150 [Microbispora corallina]|uniref:DUF5753 domain-containing protein n=1 Tax=Microbispora corallina TaxID=83302 RepID=A0ABQ4G646_9ACTN|nr:hypothetical protein Mco01_55570 [Microbispora corallina]
MRHLDDAPQAPSGAVTLICMEPLIPGTDDIAVDQVFPYSYMVLLDSGNRPRRDLEPGARARTLRCAEEQPAPTPDELTRLAQRNEAIMHLPHPLKRTLQHPPQPHRPTPS